MSEDHAARDARATEGGELGLERRPVTGVGPAFAPFSRVMASAEADHRGSPKAKGSASEFTAT